MRKNTFWLALSLFVALSSVSVLAQEAEQSKTISGGVLNGKASYLAVPKYPAAAKAVNAEGSVNVQITIDENGGVTSAAATSGHPLLRAAAVEAARQSKFKPTTLSGQPVKVSGIIVYNFVAAKNNWFTIGSELSKTESASTLRYFNFTSILKTIPADWSAEREQIQRLEELKKQELETQPAPKEIVINKETTKNADGSITTSVVTKKAVIDPNRDFNAEKTAIAQSLIASLQGRLGGDNQNLWYFNLGVNINKLLVKANAGNEERQNALEVFREYLNTAPADVPKEVIEASNNILSIVEKQVFDDAALMKIGESTARIRAAVE